MTRPRWKVPDLIQCPVWDEPAFDEEWRHLGVVLASAVLIHAAPTRGPPLMDALLHPLDLERQSMPLAEFED